MRKLTILLIILSVFLIQACSGSSQNPVSNDNSSKSNPVMSDPGFSPVFISDRDSSGDPSQGMGSLGVFQGYVNPVSLQGELVPIRNTSLTDTLEVVDITNFMMLAPCTDCVKIKSVSLDSDGNPVVRIGVKHPFPAGDPFKPISGRNRADLHVFNVEGIVAAQTDSASTFPSMGVTIADTGLLNPDGYSTYLDPYLDEILPTDANAHPYIMHFDDYSQGNYEPSSLTGFTSVTNPPPSGNLVMPMGCEYDYKDYVFNVSGGRFDFIYAVGCTYAVSSAAKAMRFNPEYRVPQHNKKAASEVRVEVTSNDLIAGDTASTAQLTVKVLDINNGVVEGDALNEMAHASNIANIFVEVPGITSGASSDYTPVGGDGRDPLNPLKFTVTVTNTAGGGDGTYTGLVKVLDSYPVGQNTSPLLGGKDGIKRVSPIENPLVGVFDINEFATYATFTLEVSSVPMDPIAVIKTTPDPPDVTTQFPTVLFDGTDSYDPDGGSITLFEWDFDWDGVPANFTPDISGTQAIVEHNYMCRETDYTAGLRVTDDDTPAGISQIASVVITVTEQPYQMGTFTSAIHLGQGEFIRGDDFYHTGNAISVDSTGLAHIVTRTSTNILYRNYDGITMSSPISVPGALSSTRVAGCAVDGNDNLHVAWLGNSGVQHTVRQDGVFTGTVDSVRNPSGTYRVGLMNIESNPDGDIMITWLLTDSATYLANFEYSLDTGSGFSPSQTISYPIHVYFRPGGGGLMQEFRLVATPNGKFHQLYRGMVNDSDPSNENIFDLVYNGTDWETPRTAFDRPSNPEVFTDLAACAGQDGSIHLSGRRHSTNNMEYVRYDPVTDTWMLSMLISYDSNPWIAGPMGTITMAPNGFVHRVFVEEITDKLHIKPFCQFWDEATIQAAPIYMMDSTLNSQVYGHADVEWDHDGNLLIVSENDYGSYQYETVFNKLVYN